MSQYNVKCPYCKHEFHIHTSKTRGNIKCDCFKCWKPFFIDPVVGTQAVKVTYQLNGKWVRA